MAHNPTYTIALNQARHAATVAAIGNAGILRIYDGAQPANPDVAVGAQVLLSQHTCGSPFAGAASAAHPSVLTANAIGAAVAGNTGTAAWFRILTSALVPVVDGTVGVGATFDLNVSTTAFNSGQNVTVSALTVTSATDMAVLASAIWRVRPGGNDLNGAGFDPGIASPGTDRSQQNAAQVTFNGGAISATTAGASNIITLVGVAGSAADVANCVRIASGTNFIAGWYFITAATATTWTLDRNCTTGAGSAMVGRMGGAAGGATAMPFELARSGSGPAVPGNTIYILGSSATPAAPDYSFANNFLNPQTAGNVSAGAIRFGVDPSQPTFRPFISNSGGDLFIANAQQGAIFDGLIFRCTSVGNNRMFDTALNWYFRNCTFNLNDQDTTAVGPNNTVFLNCEFLSKTGAAPTVRTTAAIATAANQTVIVDGCNFHDLGGLAISCGRSMVLTNSIFNNNVTTYVQLNGSGTFFNNTLIRGNTFNGKTSGGGDGLQITTSEALAGAVILDNIFANFKTAAKTAVNVTGTVATNDRIKAMLDYNDYFNNTANVAGFTIGANDLTLDPQFASGTDLTLSGTNLQAQAYPRGPIVGG